MKRKIKFNNLKSPVVIHENLPLFVWDSNIILLEYLLDNSYIIDNFNILELGSGVGLSGIILSILQPNKVYLTDGLECSIENIHLNLSFYPENPKISVNKLVWGEFDTFLLYDLPKIDVIISSDIFYDEDDFDKILCTFDYFFSENPDTCIISAYQIVYIRDLSEEMENDSRRACAYRTKE